jgi:hypothetical protein
MIKLFRHIRQKVFTDNQLATPTGRFTKYLLYAVGEILLVVIGILIALQVNNANEDHKSKMELEKIYQNLIQEFESNQTALIDAHDQLNWTKDGSLDLLAMMGKANEIQYNLDIDSLIEVALFWPTWKPSNFILNELRNSGKLTLLNNTEILNLLFEWERQTEFVSDWNVRMETSSQKIVDFIKEHGSLRNINHQRISITKSEFGITNIGLFDNIKFENQIDEKVVYSQFLEGVYQKANEIIEKILAEARE